MKGRLAMLGILLTLLAAMVAIPQSNVRADDDDDDRSALERIPVSGTLSDGGTFTGYVTITDIALADDERTLLVSGKLDGRATKASGERQRVRKTFENAAATLLLSAPAGVGGGSAKLAQTSRRCNILFLAFNGAFLDVLGLQLTITPFIIDLTAVSGQGRLLGNLLCAVANLLNP